MQFIDVYNLHSSEKSIFISVSEKESVALIKMENINPYHTSNTFVT